MSPRNNKDRLGKKDAGETPPVQAAASAEDLLSFVIPTELVDLPSGGKFYTEDHPLYEKDTIEIRHMTAKDEDVLTSRTLLKKGIALERVLQNIIVDKNININDLLVGDKNAVIVASRISAYGASYDTNITCPACFASAEHSFDLTEMDVKEFVEEEFSELGVERNSDGTFMILLPLTKASVNVRLLNGHDEKKLNASLANRNKKLGTKDETTLTDQFKQFVVSINNVEDKVQIGKFIDNMPANDSRWLRTAYGKLVPNIDAAQDFECPSCGFEQEMEVPFTYNFFWPK
tara:strand:+ start:4643 stop:5509 length:867 start_codon:yes stop_codon:yes gene_type:complete